MRNSCFWSRSISPLSSLRRIFLLITHSFYFFFSNCFPKSTTALIFRHIWTQFPSLHTWKKHSVLSARLWPGDVVRGAGGEAGLQAVRAVHADGVRGRPVVRVRQGVQVHVGLGDDPAAKLIPSLPLFAHVSVAVARWKMKTVIEN